MYSRRRQRGLSLIEVVVFIIVLGIGFAGILVLYNQLTRTSVDSLVRKQTLAIASSLLEEIELRGFTYCDPDDPAVFTALADTDCATKEDIGTEGAETRYGPLRFDNVSDYNSFAMGAGKVDPNIRDINNVPNAALAAYSVDVGVAKITLGDLPSVASVDDALRITVTAKHVPTDITVSLVGYRLRYAPRSP
jgi:MSHA pilin protein MshD